MTPPNKIDYDAQQARECDREPIVGEKHEHRAHELNAEVRLDALADTLATEHCLYDRQWACRDERRETLMEIVLAQHLDPEPATYLALALDDLAAPCEE